MKNFTLLNSTKLCQTVCWQLLNSIRTFSKTGFGTMLPLLLFFLLSATEAVAQSDTPCEGANRWTEGGSWNNDGTVDDKPSQADPTKGIIRCGNSADTQSQIVPFNMSVYQSASFEIDVADGGCVNPSTGLEVKPINPTNGQPIVWLNFDVRPFSGSFEVQINDNSGDKIGWALYVSNVNQAGTSENDTGVQLSGDCGDLRFVSCGVESSSTWNTIPVTGVDFLEPTNFYMALWDQDADGDVQINNFKARYGCGDGTIPICNLVVEEESVNCIDGETYQVIVPIIGANAQYTAQDENALSISDDVCLNNLGDGGPIEGSFTLTYAIGTNYDIDIFALENPDIANCANPFNPTQCTGGVSGSSPVPPTPSLATDAVCAGFESTFTATAGFDNYIFFTDVNGDDLLDGGDTELQNSASNTYSAVQTDGDVINVQVGQGDCIGYAEAEAEVDANPTPSLATDAVCAGFESTFTATAGFDNYIFFTDVNGDDLLDGGDTELQNSASNTYSAVQTDGDVINVQVGQGDCIGYAEAEAEVDANPTPSLATDAVCAGFESTFTATAGFDNYIFFTDVNGDDLLDGGDTELQNSASNTYSAVQADGDVINVQVGQGDCIGYAEAEAEVDANPTPSLATDAVCAGFESTFTATAGFDNYIFFTDVNGDDLLDGGDTELQNSASNTYSAVQTDGDVINVQVGQGDCIGYAEAEAEVDANPTPSLATDAVCAGFESTFTATAGFDNYIFFTDVNGDDLLDGGDTELQNSASNTYSAVQADGDVINVQVGQGDCIGYAEAEAEVDANPTPSLATDAVCAGFESTFTATAGFDNYIFFTDVNGDDLLDGGDTELQNSASNTYSAVQADGDVINVQVGQGDCIGYAEAEAEVDANPTPSLATDAVCAGFESTFTATAGFDNYIFFTDVNGDDLLDGGDTELQNSASNTYSAVQTDGDVINVQVGQGDCIGYAEAEAEVDANPTPSLASDAVCAGFESTFTATAGFDNYIFFTDVNGDDLLDGGDTELQNSASNTYSAVQADGDVINVQVGQGDCIGYAEAEAEVDANPTPSLATDAVCAGFESTFTATAGFDNYIFFTDVNGDDLLDGGDTELQNSASNTYSAVQTDGDVINVQVGQGDCIGYAEAEAEVDANPTPSLATDAVCAGFESTFTATAGFDNYIFFTDVNGDDLLDGGDTELQNSASNTYSAVQADGDVINVQVGQGDCIGYAEAEAEVDANPTPSLATDAVCAGFESTFTATAGFDNYIFFTDVNGDDLLDGGDTELQNSASNTYSAVQTDGDVINVQVGQGDCIGYAEAEAEVDANPTPSLATDAVCAGFESTFTATAGFDNYIFFTDVNGDDLLDGGDTELQNSASNTYSAVQTDGDVINVQVGQGDCIGYAEAEAEVDANPTPSLATDAVCAGFESTFTATAGFDNYIFFTDVNGDDLLDGGDTELQNSASNTYSAVQADGDVINVQVGQGDCIGYAEAEAEVDANPTPSLATDAVCAGFESTFTATAGFDNYIFFTDVNGDDLLDGGDTELQNSASNTYSAVQTDGDVINVQVGQGDCIGYAEAEAEVDANPTPSLATDAVCAGFESTFTATAGFDNYIFFTDVNGDDLLDGGDTELQNSASNTYSAVQTDGDVINVQVGQGDCIGYAEAEAEVDANPTPSLATDAVCAGFESTFTATAGFDNYIFFTDVNGDDLLDGGDTELQNSASNTYSAVQADGDVINVQVGQGDCIGYAEAEAEINPKPAIPEIQIKQADCIINTGSITITSSKEGLTFLLIRIDGDALLVIEDYENLDQGDYELTAESEAGCVSNTLEFTIEGPRDVPITPIVDKIDPDCETLQGTVIVTSRTIGLRFAILLSSNVPADIASIPDSEFMTYVDGGFGGFSAGDYTVVAKSNDGCLSGVTTVSLIEPICEEFEGCTLGYWKNHTDRWSCYSTCTLYSEVFGIGEDHYVPDELQGKTLLQVLNLGGGGVYNMGRQSVAALLNICHGDVNYEILTEAELVLYVQDSFDNAGAAGSYLDELNNAGCTLGGSRATTAPSEGCDAPENNKPGKGKPGKNNKIAETGNFKASPVPFNERLTIQYDFEYTSNKIEIQVYDLNGRLLRTYNDKKVTKGDTKELDIDFALKANQVYIVRMITDREVISKNVISSTKK